MSALLAFIVSNPVIVTGAFQLVDSIMKFRALGELKNLPPEVEAEILKRTEAERSDRDDLIDRGENTP